MEITYEVYTLEKGRWIIDSRYQNSEKEKAIEEAKMLAKQPHIEATRVVRETYSTEDGLAREKTIFDSRPKEDQEGGASEGADEDEFDGDFDDEFGGSFDDDGGGGGRGGGIADESEISYEIPGFEDLERGSPAPAPAVRRSARPRRQAGTQAAAGRRSARPRRQAGTQAAAGRQSAPPQRQAGTQAAVRRRAISPGASLFYKMIVIIVVSFGFAALTTFIYTRVI